ncbi:MAG: hypothetical protein ACPIB2_04705, partial [Flavobacteriaceae bacterium]
NILHMSIQLSLLLCCCTVVLSAQSTGLSDSLPTQTLRKMMRQSPAAQKAYRHYKVKTVGGSVVGASGVLLLSYSLGTISKRQPHQWEQTALGVGLVGLGLWISKGAKAHRNTALKHLQATTHRPLRLKVKSQGIVLLIDSRRTDPKIRPREAKTRG